MSRAVNLIIAALFALAALAPVAAMGADAVPTEMDPVAAARLVKLSEKLRCLVCQNQTIADSNAELAKDLRQQIREQIAAGKTDDEIATYMVNRYGDFVLYQPPVKPTTYLLWIGPALLLLGGFFVLIRNLRRRPAAEPSLTAEEHEQAVRLLAGDNGKLEK
jgi:cytochrome c-type biogenesis protein CcmH